MRLLNYRIENLLAHEPTLNRENAKRTGSLNLAQGMTNYRPPSKPRTGPAVRGASSLERRGFELPVRFAPRIIMEAW